MVGHRGIELSDKLFKKSVETAISSNIPGVNRYLGRSAFKDIKFKRLVYPLEPRIEFVVLFSIAGLRDSAELIFQAAMEESTHLPIEARGLIDRFVPTFRWCANILNMPGYESFFQTIRPARSIEESPIDSFASYYLDVYLDTPDPMNQWAYGTEDSPGVLWEGNPIPTVRMFLFDCSHLANFYAYYPIGNDINWPRTRYLRTLESNMRILRRSLGLAAESPTPPPLWSTRIPENFHGLPGEGTPS